MYSLSLVVGNLATPLRLMYRTKERADASMALMSDHPTQDLRIEDDFGMQFIGKATSIHARLLESLDQALPAYVATTVFQERVKAKAIQQIRSDPSFQTGQRSQVLAPAFNGGITQ